MISQRFHCICAQRLLASLVQWKRSRDLMSLPVNPNDARTQDGHNLPISRNYGSRASYIVTKQPLDCKRNASSRIKYSAPTPTLENYSWLDKTCQRVSHVPELSLCTSGIYTCSIDKAVLSTYWSWAVHFVKGNGCAKSLERCM